MTSSNPQLDAITLRQMTWKPGISRTIAGRIVLKALSSASFWPDEVDLSGVNTEDVNCIGTSYRNLRENGVITRTGQFRASKSERSNGRSVFQYRLASVERAKSWLKANGYKDQVRFQAEQLAMF